MVEKVEANGNTSNLIDYSINDDQEYQTTVYYRLVQYDFDGQNETFGPIVVQSNSLGNNFQASVFPNPSTDGQVSIQISGMNIGTATTLQIMNGKGNVVLYDTIDNATSTVYSLKNKIELEPGLYILRIVSGTSKEMKKIIIQ
nr:T9SS type A sorting domain-containing protein [Flammeovirga sp. EKP202]